MAASWNTIADRLNSGPGANGSPPDTGRLVDEIRALLPAAALNRYLTLRNACDDAASVAGGLAELARLAREAKDEATQRVRLLRQPPTGLPAGDDHPGVQQAQAALDGAVAELKRIVDRQEAHHAATRASGALMNNTDRWLRETARAGKAFAEIELVDPPKLLKGEDHRAAVERLRRRSRELDADRNRIESAPYPSAIAKAVAAAQINAIADLAAPNVSNCVEHGGPLIVNGQMVEPAIVLPKRLISAETHGPGGVGVTSVEQIDAAGLLAWLFRDALVAKIGEEIDREADDKIALTAEQRQEQLLVIQGDRDAVERAEADLLFAALEVGIAIEPRGDMAPECFLGIAAAPAGADAIAGSSPERTSREVRVAGREREVIPSTRPRPAMAQEAGVAIPPSRSGA